MCPIPYDLLAHSFTVTSVSCVVLALHDGPSQQATLNSQCTTHSPVVSKVSVQSKVDLADSNCRMHNTSNSTTRQNEPSACQQPCTHYIKT